MTYDIFADLLRDAVSGKPDAIDELLRLYMPLINRNSVVDGRFDEDCRQYILLQVAAKIRKFKF